MAYKMYMDDVLIPITPKKVQMKINNQNKTLVLIGGEEINILKDAGLTEVTFDLLLPQVPYPFAVSAEKADYYLSKFEKLKTSKKPFQWILNRQMPKGSKLFYCFQQSTGQYPRTTWSARRTSRTSGGFWLIFVISQ